MQNLPNLRNNCGCQTQQISWCQNLSLKQEAITALCSTVSHSDSSHLSLQKKIWCSWPPLSKRNKGAPLPALHRPLHILKWFLHTSFSLHIFIARYFSTLTETISASLRLPSDAWELYQAQAQNIRKITLGHVMKQSSWQLDCWQVRQGVRTVRAPHRKKGERKRAPQPWVLFVSVAVRGKVICLPQLINLVGHIDNNTSVNWCAILRNYTTNYHSSYYWWNPSLYLSIRKTDTLTNINIPALAVGGSVPKKFDMFFPLPASGHN